MSGKRFHNAVFFLFLFTAVGFVAQDVSEKRRGELPQPGTSNDSYMWPAERIPPRCKCRFFLTSLLERRRKTAPRVCSLPPPTHPSLDVKAPQPLFYPALSLRGCAAAAARSDHMRSISRQECARGGASLDEELCGAWPAAAEHMARTSCGLLLMASAACVY